MSSSVELWAVALEGSGHDTGRHPTIDRTCLRCGLVMRFEQARAGEKAPKCPGPTEAGLKATSEYAQHEGASQVIDRIIAAFDSAGEGSKLSLDEFLDIALGDVREALAAVP